MNKRMILPLIFGLVGAAILVSLGTWQLRRLDWKETVLAEIDARITAAPVALPAQPDPEQDRFLPVTATGTLLPGIQVLSSVKKVGAGFRVIDVLDSDGRRVLVDRGFLKVQDDPGPRPDGPVTIIGNLHWPDEVDKYTPAPDIEKGDWFARDLPVMADHLGAEPVLIVARDITPASPAIRPLPVDSSGIPNDHLQYAITWFSLACVWLGMTALFLWRIRRGTE
ncbi:SURF1 family protein [Actibacterium sp. XHP0104]|uniref:SURF1 family protein n=1 Tax=Actibacterium sp. XHP0104 TaxID=2984335 RepID=UPI0021E71552|nr:SURF1 family protein [Actibacterium sp. XHP0104]MCV2880533.1 SURF1 family protein [Actibacterium sp. XHP0104]